MFSNKINKKENINTLPYKTNSLMHSIDLLKK